MKNLPACLTCVHSGLLCSNCQERLENGTLTEFELDLSKDLIELEEKDEKFGFLKNISFYKAIDYEDVVILVVGTKDKLKINEVLLNWIKEKYDVEKIIVIEKTNKPRPVVEALIFPNKVVSLNEIFLATGEIEFKAVINESDKEKILFTKEELEGLILELSGIIMRIEFI